MRYLFVALLCLACGLASAATVTVTIDYSTDNGAWQNKGSGYLGHIDTVPHRPVDAYLEDELDPYLWRSDNMCTLAECIDGNPPTPPTTQDRAYAASDIFHDGTCCRDYADNYGDGCSDLTYGYEPWTGAGASTWSDVCTARATEAIKQSRNPMWDLWNEPTNAPAFKVGGTGAFRGYEFAETYRVCYEALDTYYTAQGETLTVGGPSMPSNMLAVLGFLFKEGEAGEAYIDASSLVNKASIIYNATFGFIEYLETNAATVQLDFLSLHLFGDEWVMDWNDWIGILRGAIMAEINEVGDELTLLQAQWGTDLSGLPIYVNEMMGGPATPTDIYHPGHCVVALAELHEAGVNGMARACWDDPEDSSSGCSNKTLTGLLRPDGGTSPSLTRAVWWTYKYYAELSGRESPVSSDYARIHGVAAVDATPREYRALVGFTNNDSDGAYPTDTFDVLDVTMEGLGPDCVGATVAVKHVAAASTTGTFVEDDLQVNTTVTANVSGGSITVSVANFDESDAVYVTVYLTDCHGTRTEGVTISGGIIP